MVKANKYRLPILKIYNEYEYVNIERKTLGVRNDFGEATTAWTTVSTDVRATKFPMSQLSADKLAMFEQGLIQLSSHWAMVSAGVSILTRDRLLDENSKYYDVLETVNYRSHREALLRILEG